MKEFEKIKMALLIDSLLVYLRNRCVSDFGNFIRLRQFFRSTAVEY